MKINFKVDKMLIITSIMCLLPIIFGIAVYNKLPASVPSHWNFKGEVDDYLSKAMMVFGLPIFMCVLNMFAHFIINNDPKKQNAGKMMVLVGKLTVPILCIFLVPISLLKGVGVNIPIETVVPIFIGMLFIFLGNYMPKCKQNYTAGIKLPWTLNSEENWNKTHRFAGKVWMVGGVLIMVCGALDNPAYLFFVIMIVVVFIPTIYSYRLYKKGI